MAADISIWRKQIETEIKGLADEEFQRTVWFGAGTEWVDSPDEQFCRFFDDADIPAFLARVDNGLNREQTLQLTRLSRLMRSLSDSTPISVRPEELIDDPRWVEIREQAAFTYKILSNNS